MYVCMNYLNISLVDHGEEGAGSGPGEPGAALHSALAGPFSFSVVQLGAESSSGSLKTPESLWGFL